MHEDFYSENQDTIVAVATASGHGGVGIVRLSGPLAPEICKKISGILPEPRRAHYSAFKEIDNSTIDLGVTLYFNAPHSFTGEEVVEFQGHGGPVVLDRLIQRCVSLGARLAKPGEYSERAFINGKLDLIQAEAVADLISAGTVAAAKSAINSLKGDFSNYINDIDKEIVSIRVYVEAAIDFPDEEVAFLQQGQIQKRLEQLSKTLDRLLDTAKQGVLLKEGMVVAIIGEPNVGKSSLLNALCQQDVAIVSPIPGTTRDLVKEQINLEGIPLQVIDTAGIRDGADNIEEQGIERAKAQLSTVDKILWVSTFKTENPPVRLNDILKLYPDKLIKIVNKIDLYGELGGEREGKIFLSAKTREGLSVLKRALRGEIDLDQSESIFIARRRHIIAIELGLSHVRAALTLLVDAFSSECIAEELRLAHLAFCEITGEFKPDDLLGKIFSEFCIGK